MLLSQYSVVALSGLLVVGFALLVAATWKPARRPLHAPDAWKRYRFGFSTYALIFLAFDMEMIFMYPWAVVFAELGMKAFLDMLVFIAILSAGVVFAWGIGGLKWE